MRLRLSGRTIVVTRALGQATELISLFERQGANVLHIPSIQMVPPASWQACDRAISRLEHFDWVVFTSGNGIAFFTARLRELNVPITRLQERQIAAVGESTSECLHKHGVRVTLLPKQFNAIGLLNSFQEIDLTESDILLVQPEKHSGELSKGLHALGAEPVEIAVYRNQAPDLSECADLAGLLKSDHADLLTFTSPSTFRNFVAAVGRTKLEQWQAGGCHIAAIGPSTAKAIENQRVKVDILPEESSARGLLAAIENFYCEIVDEK